MGVVLKNIAMCFDRTREHPGLCDASNAEVLFRLLDDGAGQRTWYHSGARTPLRSRGVRTAALRWREAAIDDARAAIADAYSFLIDGWERGDRIFIFGVGRGALCACELARLLGTVGLLPAHRRDLVDYMLATYALPRTRRTPAGLAAGEPTDGQARRTTRNRRARAVFGDLGHHEAPGSGGPIDG